VSFAAEAGITFLLLLNKPKQANTEKMQSALLRINGMLTRASRVSNRQTSHSKAGKWRIAQ
jgi:hypothetical protein